MNTVVPISPKVQSSAPVAGPLRRVPPMVIIVTAMTVLMETGSEGLIFTAGKCATFAAFGMALGAFFKLKNKEEKSLSMKVGIVL